MLLGAEIAMIILGLYALIMGKFPTNKKAKHTLRGWPARLIGAIGLLPIPLGLLLVTSVAVLFTLLGKQVTPESLKWIAVAIEVSVVAACAIAMGVLARIFQTPVEPPPAAEERPG